MHSKNHTPWKPLILKNTNPEDCAEIARITSLPGVNICDHFKTHARELIAIKNPSRYFSPDFDVFFESIWESEFKEPDMLGVWVWYSWKQTLVHTLSEDDFVTIRTSRNRLLIHDDEQTRFRNARIGIAGLSVGYSIALGIVLEGGGKYMKLADKDTLDLSNMNRIPVSICDVETSKIIVTAQKLYEIDPFLELELYSDGLTKENASTFTKDLDILVDEVDNLAIKKILRKECTDAHIPIVMATDNEETGMIDIERHDTEAPIPYFNGRMTEHTVEELESLSKQKAGALIAQFVGEEFTTNRMRESLGAIGSHLISWPQIGGTALLNGGVMAYVIRSIINGEQLHTGRYAISLPRIFSSRQ